MRVTLFYLAVFFSFAYAQTYPYPARVAAPPSWTQGTITNTSIFYQTDDFYFFGNVKNPITVKITYSAGANYEANVCLNSYAQDLPISGVDLESACPNGGFGVVSNDTLPNGAEFDSSNAPDGSTDKTTSAEVYVKPASDLGFVVTVPDAVGHLNFTLWWEAYQCDPGLFPIGSNSQCLPISNLNDRQVVSIGAGSWAYYRISLPGFSYQTNSFNVSINGTQDGIQMYLQEGYIPTQDWYLNPVTELDGDDNLQASVLTPGKYYSGQVYYLGVYNSNDGTRQVSINQTFISCNSSSSFGYLCRHKNSNNTAAGGIKTISATISPGDLSGSNNNGSALRYDYSDDTFENDYAYFALTNYPNYPLPYYIRVSVGNNEITDLSAAPALYAKLGGLPSAQSNDYNVSTYGDVAHQIVVPMTSALLDGGNGPSDEDSTWYFAVQLPSDFTIWVGANCANNCSSGEHGDCYCDTGYCVDVANNTNPQNYYRLPRDTQDSAGACSCDKKKYDFSFDCSQKDTGNSALYVLLIAIGGFIILAVAIGVPIYCYVASKKTPPELAIDEM